MKALFKNLSSGTMGGGDDDKAHTTAFDATLTRAPRPPQHTQDRRATTSDEFRYRR
jgi:hypothetical protein